jgi:hypothetical protein
MTVTLAVPVPTISKTRVFHDDEPAITVSDGAAPWPSMVSVLAAFVPFWTSSCPALVSLSVIEVVTSMVLLASLLVSADAIAARNALSEETLNVLSAIRASRYSRNAARERRRRIGARWEDLLPGSISWSLRGFREWRNRRNLMTRRRMGQPVTPAAPRLAVLIQEDAHLDKLRFSSFRTAMPWRHRAIPGGTAAPMRTTTAPRWTGTLSPEGGQGDTPNSRRDLRRLGNLGPSESEAVGYPGHSHRPAGRHRRGPGPAGIALSPSFDKSDIVDHYKALRLGEFINAGLHVIPDDPSHADQLPAGQRGTGEIEVFRGEIDLEL